MVSAILDFDDLRRVSRLGERATLARVEAWARRSGIRFQYDGRGGIWTTIEAMNAALGITASPQPQGAGGMYSPDMVI